jgi:hypothetical protein
MVTVTTIPTTLLDDVDGVFDARLLRETPAPTSRDNPSPAAAPTTSEEEGSLEPTSFGGGEDGDSPTKAPHHATPPPSHHGHSSPTPAPKITPAPTAAESSESKGGTGGGLDMQSYGIIALIVMGLIVAVVFWRFCKAWKLRRERHMLRVQSTRVDAVLGDMQVRSILPHVVALLGRIVVSTFVDVPSSLTSPLTTIHRW